MKPEKLIICGWGPYKEKTVIDFEKWNTGGLFLVTGQTGAGKTTIFDAIAYALYGSMSGGMREKATVRSDFAKEDTKTYVELFMKHKQKSYHIIRNPEYLRPKKRKSGENTYTKEKESAALTMPDGSVLAGNQEVTEKVKELLQMDGKQFCQISMIAQGEFAKLLFASSADKNAIFRELFGTGLYERVQGELKRRSLELYDTYRQFINKMEEDVRMLPLEDEEWIQLTSSQHYDFKKMEAWLEDRLTLEQEKEEQKKQEESEAEMLVLKMQKELERIRQLNLRFEELEKAGEKVKQLEESIPEHKNRKVRIEAAKKARILVLEEQAIAAEEKNVTDVSEQKQRYMTEVSLYMEQAKHLKKLVDNKEELEKMFEAVLRLKEQKTQGRMAEGQLKDTERKLEAARQEYQQAQQEAEEKTHQYEQADARYKKAVIGIAARMVQEGVPCPVCGSVEHPRIAQLSEDVPDEKQLEQWKKQMEEAKQRETVLYEKAFALVNEERQWVQKSEEILAQIGDLEEKIQVSEAWILDYVQNHDRNEWESECNLYRELDTRIMERKHQVEECDATFEKKQKELEIRKSRFLLKRKQEGFEDRKEYEQAVEWSALLDKMEKEYEEWERNYAAAAEVKTHLEERLKGQAVADESLLAEEFLETQSNWRKCRTELEKIHLLQDKIAHSLSGIRKNGRQVEKIQKEYGMVKDLDDLANGNNARRLVFEQFVLTGYFERILCAANKRLVKMTDGRYELLRGRQVSDGRKKDNLEIVVMDYYTGKQRSVKTLSGGETFKASLALALGLSDCVQAQNGGLEVETLFIDEGFGALDEESLDQACNTLLMLAGNNRMVGIISHVAQLRERIEQQIVVEKHNDGSRVHVI